MRIITATEIRRHIFNEILAIDAMERAFTALSSDGCHIPDVA
jgi:hypothetical protein